MNAFEPVTSAPAIDLNAGPFHVNDQYMKNRLVPDVGHKYCLRDGREFLFVRTKSNIALGAPVCVPAAGTNVKIDVPAGAVSGSKELTLATLGIDFGGGAGVLAEGHFVGGKVIVPSGTAAGVYGIKKSTAGTAAVNITVTLDRVLSGALAAGLDVFVTQFELANTAAYAAATPVVIGFAIHPFTGGTNSRYEYGYIQTKGIGGVKIKTNTSIAVGSNLVLGDAGGLILEAAHAKQPLAISQVAAANIANGDIVPALIL